MKSYIQINTGTMSDMAILVVSNIVKYVIVSVFNSMYGNIYNYCMILKKFVEKTIGQNINKCRSRITRV